MIGRGTGPLQPFGWDRGMIGLPAPRRGHRTALKHQFPHLVERGGCAKLKFNGSADHIQCLELSYKTP